MEPEHTLSEAARRMRDGGRIALVSQPRQPGSDSAATARAGRELRDLLVGAGFTGIRTETLSLDPPVVCVLAVRPAAG